MLNEGQEMEVMMRGMRGMKGEYDDEGGDDEGFLHRG